MKNKNISPENWSSFTLMRKMLSMVKPLWKEMILAITTGVLGFVLSFGLGVLGVYMLLSFLDAHILELKSISLGSFSTSFFVNSLIICALLRGVLYYFEQFFNHLIAFKILAIIRNKVFKAMRKLAPSKLDTKEKGQLISMIMGDIELLEVFYAHTISPIAIAILTSVILFLFMLSLNPLLTILPIISQITIGALFPIYASKKGEKIANQIRDDIGSLNNQFLDKISGIREIIQYGASKSAIKRVRKSTDSLLDKQQKLIKQKSVLSAYTDSFIIFFSSLQAIFAAYLYSIGTINASLAIIAILLTLSSFAPVIALSKLGNTLTKTFACARRVLALLEEEATVKEVRNGKDVDFRDIKAVDLDFRYDENTTLLLKDLNFKLSRNEIIGIKGDSGSGKSTLLKLFMRFWDTERGRIEMNSSNIKNLDTSNLYSKFNYMTQSTMLFTGTIRDNMLIARENSTDDEIYSALKKAAIYDYVLELPNKLDTEIEELGSNFSGGERQRLGLARCFLANREIFLLDEPTSNLDSLNEGIILKSLVSEAKDKTILFVSHRESTLGVCKRVVRMKDGKLLNI